MSLKLELEEAMFKVVSGDAHRSDVRVLMGAGLKLLFCHYTSAV